MPRDLILTAVSTTYALINLPVNYLSA